MTGDNRFKAIETNIYYYQRRFLAKTVIDGVHYQQSHLYVTEARKWLGEIKQRHAEGIKFPLGTCAIADQFIRLNYRHPNITRTG